MQLICHHSPGLAIQTVYYPVKNMLVQAMGSQFSSHELRFHGRHKDRKKKLKKNLKHMILVAKFTSKEMHKTQPKNSRCSSFICLFDSAKAFGKRHVCIMISNVVIICMSTMACLQYQVIGNVF